MESPIFTFDRILTVLGYTSPSPPWEITDRSLEKGKRVVGQKGSKLVEKRHGYKNSGERREESQVPWFGTSKDLFTREWSPNEKDMRQTWGFPGLPPASEEVNVSQEKQPFSSYFYNVDGTLLYFIT